MKYLIVFFLGICTAAAQSVWQPVIVPSAGALQAFLVYSDSNMLAGTANGGIYNSTDGGATWITRNSGLSTNDIRSLAIGTQGNFYAGTNGKGVFISNDSGASWIPLGNGLQGFVISTLVADSTGHIYALTDAGKIYLFSQEKKDWVNTGLGNVTCIVASKNGGIYVGTNNGNVIRYDGAAEVVLESGIINGTIYVLTVDANNTLYAATAHTLYKHPGDSSNIWAGMSGLPRGPYVQITTVAVHDSEMFVVGALAATESYLYYSSDNGKSWLPMGYSYPVIAMFVPAHDVVYKATTSSINLSSVDLSKELLFEWDGVGPEEIGDFTSYSLALNTKGDLFVGTPTELLRSTDNCLTWSKVIGQSVDEILIDKNDNIYAASWDKSSIFFYLFRSSDNGKNWNVIDRSNSQSIISPTLSPNGFIYFSYIDLGDGYVYYSKNGGLTWAQANKGGIVVADDSEYIFLASGINGFNRSTNGGETWLGTGPGFSYTYTPYELFSTPNGYTFAAWDTVMYRTSDHGVTWTVADSGIPKKAVISSPTMRRNGEIYLLADSVSYFSTDEGLTWKLFGTGLPAGVKFTSIAVNDSGMIYGGGTDGIIYRNTSPAPSSVAQDRMSLTNALLAQNYPNPFSGTTTIRVTLAPNEIVGARLNIYNMLGTPVADLTDKLQQNADITFDAGTLPEGVYYYILEIPSGRQARQMFVVR